MSRESKILQAGIWGAEKTVYHYECFGWELIQIADQKLVFSRETQDDVYPQLVAYESEYNTCANEKRKMNKPNPPLRPAAFNLILCIILFICLIVPGVLYVLNYKKEKESYEARYAQYGKDLAHYNTRTAELTERMANLLLLSRDLFFSKRVHEDTK